jgi:hypothetical protein
MDRVDGMDHRRKTIRRTPAPTAAAASGVQSPLHLAGVWLVPINVQMVSMLAVMPQPEAKTA